MKKREKGGRGRKEEDDDKQMKIRKQEVTDIGREIDDEDEEDEAQQQ